MNFCNAQNEVRYQGEANLGISIGSGSFGYNRISLHTIQGAKIEDNISLGLGIGLDWWRGIYKEYWDRLGKFDSGELTLPIYLNAKGYLPMGKDFMPYISCDLGYAMAVTEGLKEYGGGLYFSPAVGFISKTFKAELAFVLQKIDSKDFELVYDVKSSPAFKLSIGYIF